MTWTSRRVRRISGTAQVCRRSDSGLSGGCTRIYLAGFSQGCIMSLAVWHVPKVRRACGNEWALVTEIVAGLATPSELRNFPMIVVHGIADTVIEVKYGRSIRDYFAKLPVDLTYRNINGTSSVHSQPGRHQPMAFKSIGSKRRLARSRYSGNDSKLRFAIAFSRAAGRR
ncbi:MAG: hypothetical protein WKF37_08420 [Bryobacteraceae bacterium]